MLKRIFKLMWDYNSTGLWGGGEVGDVEYNFIGISKKIQDKIQKWINRRNSYVDWKYPPDSPAIPENIQKELDIEGKRIVEELNNELGYKYIFIYNPMFKN